ncbi:MAG: nucleoid-associated protein YgaU [Planctomycetota bacterium]|jgi:nucleoid-associated protein YgaU
MGKVEKIVVLSVLFLIVLILAVSLTRDPYDGAKALDEQAAGVLGNKSLALTKQEPTGNQPVLDSPGALGGAGTLEPEDGADSTWDRVGTDGSDLGASPTPDGLLSSTVKKPEADDVPMIDLRTIPEPGSVPPSIPTEPPTRLSINRPLQIPLDRNWDLITTLGLEMTVNGLLMSYECGLNDTFASVATMLYGDSKKSDLLRRNNETHNNLYQGLVILVPVQDDTSYHKVADGESLWRIAETHYDKGTMWKRIFEANRDQLSSADAVKPGMKLVIPR